MSDRGKLGFNIVDLWDKTQEIFRQNPRDHRLSFASGYPSLTKSACIDIAGSSWSRHEGSAIWSRATTWKFPLIQVFASFPRPPLNLKTEVFVIVHLLGDPIDSVQNLLLKITRCQSRIEDWKMYLNNLNLPIEPRLDLGMDDIAQLRQMEQIEECHWKSLALVTDAYDEWGQAENQVDVMLSLLNEATDKQLLLDVLRRTSDALAADRATKYLPALVALTSFIAIIGIAMARTAAAIDTPSFNASIFINIEVHSITFSTLYFWIIPTLLFGSFIGVSQTDVRIPRILDQFHDDLYRHFSEPVRHTNLPSISDRVKELKTYIAPSTDHRIFYGGIYSWQPSRWQSDASQPLKTAQGQRNARAPSQATPLTNTSQNTGSVDGQSQPDSSLVASASQSVSSSLEPQPSTLGTQAVDAPGNDVMYQGPHTTHSKQVSSSQPTSRSNLSNWLTIRILPTLIVSIPTLSSAIVSSRVPPNGWNCRVSGEVAVFFAWFASAGANLLIKYQFPLSNTNRTWLFWTTFAKDAFFALGTIIWVIMTIVGALNRCDCWIDHDSNLILPQREDIDKILRHRLNVDYPAWIFSGVAVELILIPSWVKYRYGGALKVFVQRDDGRPNFEWFWNGWDWLRRKYRNKKRTNSWFHLMTNGGDRGQT